jgi:hypothetical protein
VALSPIEAHYPDRPGVPSVIPEDPEIVYQMPRGGIAALAAPIIEGTNILLSLKRVGTDGIECIRQIKLMRLIAAVVIHVGPIIYHQPIERVPQRQIVGVRHWHYDPLLCMRPSCMASTEPATSDPAFSGSMHRADR